MSTPLQDVREAEETEEQLKAGSVVFKVRVFVTRHGRQRWMVHGNSWRRSSTDSHTIRASCDDCLSFSADMQGDSSRAQPSTLPGVECGMLRLE